MVYSLAVCGIAGVLGLTDRPPDPAWGPLLLDALRHRGPDGHALFAEGRVLLAHTRLAIIDLGSGGDQPMRSADDRHVIVQNGEIYNYRDLAEKLTARGVTLRSRSDTEVLLERLARDGPRAFDDLRGMWAFALWDRERETLLLARDRLGKKPLLIARTPEFVAFASEATALLRLPFVRARLDRASLPSWLRFLYVPTPDTLIEGVKRLPPASWVELSAARPDAEPVRYWSPPAPDPAQRADREWFEAFDRELIESARLRTVSDVPIGVFLSGGLDSNVVLEALRRGGQSPIRTYTLGFAGESDERPLARLGAARWSDQHTELELKPDLAGEIDGVLAHFGDPLGDSAVVTTALLAREARQHVKVIVNGDGGDELFGGYPRYRFACRADRARDWPGALPLLRRAYGARPTAGESLASLARHDAGGAARALGSVCSSGELARLLVPGACPERAPAAPPWPGASGPGLLDATFAWDGGVYLPDDLLVKIDVASMAHGLENRSPLLDHRLFEHVARLVPARRAEPWRTKPLLRHYAANRLPAPLLHAPKRGFQLPLERWLRGPLSGWLESLAGNPQATAPLLHPGVVRDELAAFRERRGGDTVPYRLWALAVLEWWARHFSVELGS
ncbi:MAG TPA: asparagine synthase (glutamine-hydrolyzing) [Candidatus Sulfotelmatobacter sp.]|nr:asparagine synthase (glutamine-hydrolyzing) [Candidatus Sulfotelmatobacter sp.]